MIRSRFGAGLVLAVMACSGGNAPATTPTPTPARPAAPPASAVPAPTAPGAAGVPQAPRPGALPSDVQSYRRTSPPTDPVIQRMWTEGMEHSQVADLGQVLFDSIGPRLVNSDRYNAAEDWIVAKYASWGVSAKKEAWGTWNSWRRGITHLDLITPRVRSLEATMLAWSPGTGGAPVEGEVVLFPSVTTPEEYARAAPGLRGKFVIFSAPNPTCRSDEQYRQFEQPGAFAADSALRSRNAAAFNTFKLNAGPQYQWPKDAGVAGVITTNWSGYPGIDKVFGSWRQLVPYLDVTCEDFNLLYRLAEKHQGPRVRLTAESQFLGEQPVSNVIATIRGSEKPNEYIVLSAHFDSWDGGSGATDNGTGTLTMLEALRILKTVYPNPKRTIIVGHWAGEEQGLNGSKAYAEDHPEVLAGLRAGWNQDNGTGRVTSISAGPFPTAPAAISRYLAAMPSEITRWISVAPASPAGTGGTDASSFQCLGFPVHGLGALGWDYGNTTWHTNRDTYDKVMMNDLKNNATLVAMLTYLADNNPDSSPLQRLLPLPPSCAKAARNTAASTR